MPDDAGTAKRYVGYLNRVTSNVISTKGSDFESLDAKRVSTRFEKFDAAQAAILKQMYILVDTNNKGMTTVKR